MIKVDPAVDYMDVGVQKMEGPNSVDYMDVGVQKMEGPNSSEPRLKISPYRGLTAVSIELINRIVKL